MPKHSSSAAFIISGILIAVFGIAMMLAGVREGLTNDQMLDRLDEAGRSYFEPVSLQAEESNRLDESPTGDFITEVSTPPTQTLTPEPPTATIAPSVSDTPGAVEVSPTPLVETATPIPTPTATALPTPAPEIPTELIIPAIELDAPIVSVEPAVIDAQGEEYRQWQAPDQFAAGWHVSSALLNETGNMVLNGHHNIYGEVFRRLVELLEGDIIYVRSANSEKMFVVSNTMILPERGEPLEVRIENARWIQPSDDMRLTLITCWPYESNTHRLIVVAVPVP